MVLGMLFVVKYYDVLMNLRAFFYATVFVESVVLIFVLAFLIFGYSYMTALSIYIGYQLTFMLGNYLVRMETIALKKNGYFIFCGCDETKRLSFGYGCILWLLQAFRVFACK